VETLEALGRRIAITNDLRGIVRTMRTLSAVNIRQCERAVQALEAFARTVTLGLQVVLRARPPPAHAWAEPEGATIAVLFGSDYGLCGQFNTQVARFALAELERRRIASDSVLLLAVGVRGAAALEARERPADALLGLPGTVAGLHGTARDILLRVDAWRAGHAVGRVLLFYNRRAGGAPARPAALQLLPLDPRWLHALAGARWPTRVLPAFSMDPGALFAALVRQHLFAAIFRAGAHSIASEHVARLAAMQAAERNIDERLEELNASYRQQRQNAITAELLDVVAGYQAILSAEAEGASAAGTVPAPAPG